MNLQEPQAWLTQTNVIHSKSSTTISLSKKKPSASRTASENSQKGMERMSENQRFINVDVQAIAWVEHKLRPAKERVMKRQKIHHNFQLEDAQYSRKLKLIKE